MKTSRRTSLIALTLWHSAGLVVAVGTLGQLLMAKALPDMRAEHLIFLLGLGLAYGVSAGVNTWFLVYRPGSHSILKSVVLVVLAFALAALLLLIVKAYTSRAELVACIVLTTALLGIARWLRPAWLIAGSVVLLILSVGVQARMDRILEERPKPRRSVSVINAGYFSLTATYYDNYFPNCDPEIGGCNFVPRLGGGITRLGPGYLLATGEGFLYYFTRDAKKALTVSRLPYNVPLNDADFATSGETKSRQRRFRVTDILVEEQPGRTTLYAAHHYYYRSPDCIVLRLSALTGPSEDIARGTLQERWTTVYETKPCLPRHAGPRSQEFVGEESGGRLARLDQSTLLMTVGDHNFNGYYSDVMAAQDLKSDYGKTLAIDPERGTSTIFTLGHRNPQGLYVTESGEVWATEHGPAGGDELNRLVRGTNYGWPLVTYGTEYGQHTWPINATPNEHRGFQEPIYSWVPSAAVSNLIRVEKSRFPFWRGDLLIGTYLQSLLRARIRGGRIVTLEPVRLRDAREGGRIRDLFEDRDGAIVISFDLGGVAFLEPADSVSVTAESGGNRGERLFGACAGCHDITQGGLPKMGPDLADVVDRPIADRAGFPYSPALTKLKGRWTAENLDRFLADPQAFAPGNTMQFSGLPDADDRAQLIEYLKRMPRSGQR